MLLKQELLNALRAGENQSSLLELIHRYQSQGTTPQESYNVLQEIWLELGFAETEEGGPVRDELEYVMERVWFQGSAKR